MTEASVAHSKLMMKADELSYEAKEELHTNMQEARRLAQELEGLGKERKDILLHALSGLANAKIGVATGEETRTEVIGQLFNLLNEIETFESTSTKVSAALITSAVSTLVVTASAEQIPST